MDNSYLDKAIFLATTLHEGQLDKAGRPYILHPLKLMIEMDTLEEQIVAVLHDTLEDSSHALIALEEIGFKENILGPLRLLTKVKGTLYLEYIKKLSTNPIARKVKIADLRHNIDLNRLEVITENDIKRSLKYQIALDYLINLENTKKRPMM